MKKIVFLPADYAVSTITHAFSSTTDLIFTDGLLYYEVIVEVITYLSSEAHWLQSVRTARGATRSKRSIPLSYRNLWRKQQKVIH